MRDAFLAHPRREAINLMTDKDWDKFGNLINSVMVQKL